MPDSRITDAKELLDQVSAFGEEVKDRRRFRRRKLMWAANVEVRGQRFEGTLVDFSASGARIRFDAPVNAGDELTLVLKQLDDIGAKVVWRHHGEAGLQFLLAPEEVATRVQEKAGIDLEKLGLDGAEALRGFVPDMPAERAPPPRAAGRGLLVSPLIAAVIFGGTALAGLTGSLVALGRAHDAPPPAPLAITGGAVDQHSCSGLLGRVNGSNNQIDFSLRVAEAAQFKCLDLHPGGDGSSLEGHVVSMTKAGHP